MSEVMPAEEHYRSEFTRVEPALPGHGNDWLAGVRRRGFDRFLESGFPSRREEDWKYTDVRPIEQQPFACPTDTEMPGASQIQPWLMPELNAHVLVFVDGRFAPALSDIGKLPDGVTLQPMSEALARPGDILREYLGKPLNGYSSGFAALNTAFMGDGIYLHMARGAALERPVHALFIGGTSTDPSMLNLRNLIVLEEGAEAGLIEHYAGSDGTRYFTNAVTEVHAGSNSRLLRYRIQAESNNAYHVASAHVTQTRDSGLTNHGVDIGGRLARTDTQSLLDAPGAEAILYGVYAPKDQQHIDNHTRVDHAKPRGRSREAYRGVIDGGGRGVFNGKVIVHKNAQKTDSEQSSDALLLSKTAEVDAKPELEIYADDVKCAHGATVGQLDENAIFYLQSRGVAADAARSLLTYSFADEILRHIRLEALRKHVEAVLLARLPDGEQIRELL